ncbi:MAG: hypothetical protein LUQ23_01115 [Methanomicrobiales archaeon]|nr:hypothetical protein [Methanomicrobiales archaeon]MDD1671106.1 hypothetical protein [Methanomicrobiales archaeon]
MDSEMRDRAREAVRRILEAAAYEVEDLERPLDLSAVGAGECVIVQCSDNAGEMAQFDRTNYRCRVEEKEVTSRKLLLTLNDSVSTENCARWGIRELQDFAGRAEAARVLGERLDLDLGHAGPGVAAGPSPEEAGPELPHVPVKVDERRARAISGESGAGTLRFIPYWRYHYRSSGQKGYGTQVVTFNAEKTGAINAINGAETAEELGQVEVSPVPISAVVLKPMVRKEEAEEKLRDRVVGELTQKVRIRQVKGDTIFYEERIFKPERRDIAIELELVHMPVWQFRGKKFVELNAVTGVVLTEPMDTGAELL